MFWKILAVSGLVLHTATLIITILIARSAPLTRAIVLTCLAPFISAIAMLALTGLFFLIIALLSYHMPLKGISFLTSRTKSLKRWRKPSASSKTTVLLI